MSGDKTSALFRYDGHISDLTADRYLYEPLSEAEKLAIDEHLAECQTCQSHMAAIQDFDGALTLKPPADNVVSLERWRFAKKLVNPRVVGALALAATLFLVIRPVSVQLNSGTPETINDGIRTKSAGFEMQVYADDEEGGRLLDSDDRVYPGLRLAFRVTTKKAGHVLIMGNDNTGAIYQYYPQDQSGAAAQTNVVADHSLDAAIVLDSVLGQERLIGVWCPTPFSFAEVKSLLTNQGGTLPDGCTKATLNLMKTEAEGL